MLTSIFTNEILKQPQKNAELTSLSLDWSLVSNIDFDPTSKHEFGWIWVFGSGYFQAN